MGLGFERGGRGLGYIVEESFGDAFRRCRRSLYESTSSLMRWPDLGYIPAE